VSTSTISDLAAERRSRNVAIRKAYRSGRDSWRGNSSIAVRLSLR